MDVTIVGSGPNGLTAAVICARAGLSVRVIEAQPTAGGGARTAPDPEFSDVRHDICSAVHPLALASPFFAEFDLRARGVQLAVPDISYANPLPNHPAAIGYRDLTRTCAELDDGASWRSLLGPLADHLDGVLSLFLGDKRSLPSDLPTAVRGGLRLLAQGTPAWSLLRGEDARALFTGVAAHTISRMPSLVSSGAGLMLATLGHAVGWPIPVGGSQSISDSLVDDLRAHGGELLLGEDVTRPPAGVVLYDTAPTALLNIYGDALPSRYANRLRRYRFGPGIAKVDFVLSGEIPWRDKRLAQAPTLHMGGTRAQMALAEREVAAGRHADWPMVLAALPHLADPTRIDSAGRRPLWTYAHVPMGSGRRPDGKNHRDLREVRARLPRRRRRRAGRPRRTAGRPQRQPGGRRHRGRRQQHGQRAHRAQSAAQPLGHPDPPRVSVFVGDPAGRRCARYVGLLRGPNGAQAGVRHQEAAAARPLDPPPYPPKQNSLSPTACGDDREFCFGVVRTTPFR